MHGVQTAVQFKHDYMSIDNEMILYERIIFWGHTEKYFKLSFLEQKEGDPVQRRVDVKLYPIATPTAGRVEPSEVADLLQRKVAALFKESTGCSQDIAIEQA